MHRSLVSVATRMMCSSRAVAASRAARCVPPPLQPLRCSAPSTAVLLGGSYMRCGLGLQRLQRALVAAAGEQEPQPQAAPAQPPAEIVAEKEYVVVNFYHLVDIPRPHEVLNRHREWMEGREVRGRIYISEQGINAQYGGLRQDAEGYARWLADTQPLFKGLSYSMWPCEGHQYPKLRLKYRPNLISLAGGMQGLPVTDAAARATPTSPAEWKRMLAEGQRMGAMAPLVLDVRNSYEWDAGHFAGAERPLEANFHETPTEALPVEVPPLLQDADPERPVMIYCTGGIRCDVYGTYLRKKGFNNLYTLEGGIQNYMRQEGLDHWRGSLFVFDGRMAVRPNKDKEEELEAAAPCQGCGATAVLPHMNCANIDCNKLFIACDGCKVKFSGCCCEACTAAPRLLRPAKTQGLYGNWSQYIDGEEAPGVSQAIAAGRGEGRTSRRQRRQAALRERELSKRALKVERRRHAKEIMSTLQQQMADAAAAEQAGAPNSSFQIGDSTATTVGDERAERLQRMARLRELRQRLAASATASV